MFLHRRWVAILAIGVLVCLASQAAASGALIGKWRLGDAETGGMLQIEFSSGGVVMFNDQVGTYWTSGNQVTIDGWNGKQVTLTYRVEGITLYLTDPKDEELVFTKVKY